MSLRRLIASLVPSPIRLPNPIACPRLGRLGELGQPRPDLLETRAKNLLDVRLLLSHPAEDTHRPQPPWAGHALEVVLAAVLEVEAGAGHQVLHGLGDEHLAGPRVRAHAGADVHGDPGDVVAGQLDLARVEAGAHLEADRAHRVAQLAAQRIARPGPSKVARKPSPSVFTSRPR